MDYNLLFLMGVSVQRRRGHLRMLSDAQSVIKADALVGIRTTRVERIQIDTLGDGSASDSE